MLESMELDESWASHSKQICHNLDLVLIIYSYFCTEISETVKVVDIACSTDNHNWACKLENFVPIWGGKGDFYSFCLFLGTFLSSN